MESRTTELERAFQLAQSGECRSVDEIRKKLAAEGYYATQVTGKGLLRQLQNIIAAEFEARNAALKRPGPERSTMKSRKPDGKPSANAGISIDQLNASKDG